MAALKLSEPEKELFANFLKHRRLNEKAVELLAQIRGTHGLKAADLRTAKQLPYAGIAGNLVKAVDQGWLDLDVLVAKLDESEYAGKQHVCIFRLPEKGKQKVLTTLRNPAAATTSLPAIADFFTIPTASTARVLVDTPDLVAVKIVTRRDYWITNVLEDGNPDRELFERLKQKERSAVIVKCSLKGDLIQFRVPSREKGPMDTAKAIYDFLKKALESHYPVDGNSWFSQIQHFPIAKAFPKILENTKEFELWHDAPEDRSTKAQISRKGRPKSGNDLRKDKNWRYGAGYFRPNLRGFWNCPSGKLYAHLNADRVRIAKDATRDFARIFVPQLCSDKDLDHVIDRIRDHF
jgi:hypothetical protein